MEFLYQGGPQKNQKKEKKEKKRKKQKKQTNKENKQQHFLGLVFLMISRLASFERHFRPQHRIQHHQISQGSYSQVCTLSSDVKNDIFLFPSNF